MKKLFLISFSLLVVQVLLAQSAGPLSLSELRRIDSLKARLEVLPPDTNRLKTLTDLSYAYNTYRKEALPYAREAAELALKLENKGAQSAALNWLAIILQFQGRTTGSPDVAPASTPHKRRSSKQTANWREYKTDWLYLHCSRGL